MYATPAMANPTQGMPPSTSYGSAGGGGLVASAANSSGVIGNGSTPYTAGSNSMSAGGGGMASNNAPQLSGLQSFENSPGIGMAQIALSAGFGVQMLHGLVTHLQGTTTKAQAVDAGKKDGVEDIAKVFNPKSIINTIKSDGTDLEEVAKNPSTLFARAEKILGRQMYPSEKESLLDALDSAALL